MRHMTIPTASTITVSATVDVLTTADDHTARSYLQHVGESSAHMINTGHARMHGDGTYQPAIVCIRPLQAPGKYTVRASYRLTTDTPHALDRGTAGAITYAHGLARLIMGRAVRRDHVTGAIINEARVDIDHERE